MQLESGERCKSPRTPECDQHKNVVHSYVLCTIHAITMCYMYDGCMMNHVLRCVMYDIYIHIYHILYFVSFNRYMYTYLHVLDLNLDLDVMVAVDVQKPSRCRCGCEC